MSAKENKMKLESAKKAENFLAQADNQGKTKVKETRSNPPRFEEDNRKVFMFFTILGIIAIQHRDGTYFIRKFRFFLLYMFWILYPLACCSVIVLLENQTQSNQNSEEPRNSDLPQPVTMPRVLMWFFFFSTVQTVSLVYINKSLPTVLRDISRLCDHRPGFETALKVEIFKRPPGERLTDDSTNNLIFFWLPSAMLCLSHVAFTVLWLSYFLHQINLDYFLYEWRFVVIHFVGGSLSMITTLFVTVFCKWKVDVYRSLYEFTSSTSRSWDRSQIWLMRDYLNTLQDIFISMSDGFFKSTVSINLINAFAGSVICIFKLLQGINQVIYILPLWWHLHIITTSCKYGTLIMDQYELLIKEIQKEIRYRQAKPSCTDLKDLTVIEEYLSQAPPQLLTLGGYKVGVSLMMTMFGFILSYSIIFDQLAHREDNIYQFTKEDISKMCANYTAC